MSSGWGGAWGGSQGAREFSPMGSLTKLPGLPGKIATREAYSKIGGSFRNERRPGIWEEPRCLPTSSRALEHVRTPCCRA
jgi:hypothetical protein